MRNTQFIAFFVMLHSLIMVSVSADELVYARAFADGNYGSYHVAVLNAALEATQEYGETVLVPHPHPMSQSRQQVSVLKGDADIMWSVTNNDREQRLLPIKLPLLKGYSGYRVLVINPAEQDKFIHQATEVLKKVTMVQGADWPDLDVLKANGYNVSGEDWSLWFHSMYSMVDKGLVDAFPRNIIEAHRDLARHTDKAITLEKHHLLLYPNYEYFFVKPGNVDLANRIRVGLIRLLKSGELETIFNQFDTHHKAQLIADGQTRKRHNLTNPSLNYTLPYARWDKQTKLAINALKQARY